MLLDNSLENFHACALIELDFGFLLIIWEAMNCELYHSGFFYRFPYMLQQNNVRVVIKVAIFLFLCH